MDIKELEFIRDFDSYLENLNKNLSNFSYLIHNDNQDEENEIPEMIVLFYDSLFNQFDLLTKLFGEFKTKVDQKYWDEWKRKYPQLLDNYDDSDRK